MKKKQISVETNNDVPLIDRFFKVYLTTNRTEVNNILKILNEYNSKGFLFTAQDCIEIIKKDKEIKRMLKQFYKNNFNLFNEYATNDKYGSNINLFMTQYILEYGVKLDSDELETCHDDIYEDSRQIYINSIRNTKILTNEEIKKLFIEIENGNKSAKKTLIESNLRLVLFVAKKYYYDLNNIMDFIQEGSIGLMNAVEKYDYKSGYSFSTYAYISISRKMNTCYLSCDNTIKMPRKLIVNINKVNQFIKDYTYENEHSPSDEEIAAYFNLTLSEVKRIMKYNNIYIQSLDAPILNFEDPTELHQFIPSEENLESSYENIEMKQNVKNVIESLNLSEVQRGILDKRFPLNGEEPMTLRAIGKYYNISYERVRQIEKQILRKLRLSEAGIQLNSYLPSYDLNDKNNNSLVSIDQKKYSEKPKKTNNVKCFNCDTEKDSKIFNKVINEFNDIEKQVVCMIFGYGDNLPFSTQDVARDLELSEKEVLSIIKRTLLILSQELLIDRQALTIYYQRVLKKEKI